MNEETININGETMEKSFAELLAEEEVAVKGFTPGQKVKTSIAAISKEAVFLALGGKSDGYISRQELEDKDGNLTVKIGDPVEVYFISGQGNEMRFTIRVGGGQGGKDQFADAWQYGIPVEGQVEGEVKGGYAVRLAGNTKAFCPYSQAGLRRQPDQPEFIGQGLTFKIIEYREGGKRIVLSRKSILEEERRQQKELLKESIKEGMIVQGTVSSIQPFGAFVEIGGVEGLIPISEMAWGKVDDAHEILSVGQVVMTVVLKLDWEKDRITLSLKNTLADPWEEVAEKYPEGSWQKGKVSRLAQFGAFVILCPGIEGLLHVSELGAGRRVNHPREVVEEGQDVDVRIISIDRANRRLSLSLAEDQEKAEKELLAEYKERTAIKSQIKDVAHGFGTLGELMKKKVDKKR